MSRVLKLSEILIDNAKYLKVNKSRAMVVAADLKDFELELPRWDFPGIYPQSDSFEEMCAFYLIFNSINYCYFDLKGEKFKDGKLSGATLAAKRLTEHWSDLKDPLFLSRIDENYLLADLFVAEGPISLVKQRAKALRQVGEFLNAHCNTSDLFYKLFLRYQSNAYLVSQIIPTLLDTWYDPFYKRAQLFVGMVYGRFQDWKEIPIEKSSLEDITIFSDYRVPQTLISMGIINPGPLLKSSLHKQDFIETGSRLELELRAASILGGQYLTKALDEIKAEDVNSLHTDFLLWSAGRKSTQVPPVVFVERTPKHHMTWTTDY